MSSRCDTHYHDTAISRAYARVLWVALVVNGTMFAVELTAAFLSRSVALQADALDFLGDAANYGLSLAVVGMHLRWRARAALIKGLTMGLFGIWVLATTVWRIHEGGVPEAHMITTIGTLALLANLSVTAMLFKYRDGDANMRSVWLCSRNDVIANIAVIGAGTGVWMSGTFWPDVLVGAVIALLALTAAIDVVRRARAELTVAKQKSPAAVEAAE